MLFSSTVREGFKIFLLFSLKVGLFCCIIPYLTSYYYCNMFWSKYLPITSFAISMTALLFQVTVLHPWHNELDAEFKRLIHVKGLQESRLERYQENKLEKIALLEKKLEHLAQLEAEKKELGIL